eukprot:TRINITY_DN1679_c0_g2_i1.p1 TRINITY_DN1679_c0_g2~~TRINITY_DN1679_c0_g2_i1.p1  ORF type:complete len:477 (+),score=96.20 TRINITY_DN1679_c0_g2_i1:96-1526(+)
MVLVLNNGRTGLLIAALVGVVLVNVITFSGNRSAMYELTTDIKKTTDVILVQQRDILSKIETLQESLADNKPLKINDKEEEVETPAPTKRKKRKPATEEPEPDEEEQTPAPKKKSKKKKKRKHVGIDELGVREQLTKDEEGTIPIVMFTYKREHMLKQSVSRVQELIVDDKTFRLFISQDGKDFPAVTSMADSFGDDVIHFIHDRNDSGATPKEKRQHFEPYYAISHHYGWALGEIFSIENYNRLIILEEDIDVASDFFTYMKAASPLLDEPDIFCVSSWNDNGKKDLVQSPTTLYRTDFFPGLGWMLSRDLWEELEPIWPAGFWDDWLRQPKHRKGRCCIRPEIPRSFMWCDTSGVSKGQFCRKHLSQMKLEDKPVDWEERLDLDFYKKETYDSWLDDLISSATEISEITEVNEPNKEYVIRYTTSRQFKALAEQFGLMDDFKDNVPRTAYRGIVSFRHSGSRVHLVSQLHLYEY